MLEGRIARESTGEDWVLPVAGDTESVVPPKIQSKFKADTQVEWAGLCDLMGSLRLCLPKNICTTHVPRTPSLLMRPVIPTVQVAKVSDDKCFLAGHH
jgi:hypothetical protein